MFKLSIFHEQYQLIGLSSDVFLESAFVILTDQAQTNFYANRDSIRSFKNICCKIRLFFEGLEWKHLNFIKLQIVRLADTIAVNPILSTTKCLCKMCTELTKSNAALTQLIIAKYT